MLTFKRHAGIPEGQAVLHVLRPQAGELGAEGTDGGALRTHEQPVSFDAFQGEGVDDA
nr:hypothetical protein [Deinococcus peraridilitoris]